VVVEVFVSYSNPSSAKIPSIGAQKLVLDLRIEKEMVRLLLTEKTKCTHVITSLLPEDSSPNKNYGFLNPLQSQTNVQY